MAMDDLPTEIWLHITELLPPEDVKNVYGINSTCFEISMDERYKSLEIKFNKLNEGTLQLLERLQDEPDTARRVRSFCLSPTQTLVYPNLLSPEAVKSRGSDESRYAMYRPRKIDPGFRPPTSRCMRMSSLPAEDCVTQLDASLCKIIPLFTNLERLELRCNELAASMECYNLLWDLCERSQIELFVRARVTSFAPVFKTQSQDFKIRKLVLRVARKTYGDDKKPIQSELGRQAIADLLNCCTSSLAELSIRGHWEGGLDNLYGRLTTFPLLSGLDFDICPNQSGSENQDQMPFIRKHARTIRDLTLLPVPGQHESRRSWLLADFTLPNLRSLSISEFCLSRISSSESSPGFFFTKHGSTLESLSVASSRMPRSSSIPVPRILARLLRDIRHEYPTRTLSVLSFHVFLFRPSTLTNLAPANNLEKLVVVIDMLADDSDNTGGSLSYPTAMFPWDYKASRDQPQHPFAQLAESARLLKTWRLRDLTIQHEMCCGTITLWGLMLYCAKLIPSIESFGSRGTLEVPNPANPMTHPQRHSCHFEEANRVDTELLKSPR